MALLFDTLKVSKRLTAGGFTPDQAQAAAEAFSEALSADMATKLDVQEVKADLQEVRAEIERTRLHLEAKYQEGKSDTIKWVASLIGLQTVTVLGAVVALLKIFGK